MLQSYCIQGFKSIKNATEVDLKKTQYQTLEKTNVCNGILKGCMFVGANASGKTNLIEPLRFLLMALFAVRVGLLFPFLLCNYLTAHRTQFG